MLKVFEAFAGYGSQRTALKNLNIEHEVVGISEIDGDAILSYAAIHDNLSNELELDYDLLDEDMRAFLKEINVPLDYRTFENKADKLKGNKLKNMYVANKISKNFGDIRSINPASLPDFDFFTYSFPCQDISVAGYQSGLDENSGTRSSLLWECCKIIEHKKPKILMMENVKNLVGKNHKADFEKFLIYLESLGYENHWDILNARDFNVPQNRERVFCISILNNAKPFKFPKSVELKVKVNDLLETEVDEKFFLKNNQVTDTPITQNYIYCLDSNYWKGTSLKDFLAKKRRQLVSGPQNDVGKYPSRRLTPKETWRFMGCSDVDFKKAEKFVSNTNLYRQSGNSIVIPVLEGIFKELFLEINMKEDI
ncbi:DNA cytosine methyltransferase (plasmid) [Vagococcus lutrae]|uniref:DNA cytosine methyltransferase n=1 Tax=Vagococcus lutrae TaxID=81947 RepID=UPI00232C4294|nr:DNA cytosine methyltransferase [Vagococcus lutrae]WCG06111.1 DNA cytosine methyltransferase [Vagococcus lutrae]